MNAVTNHSPHRSPRRILPALAILLLALFIALALALGWLDARRIADPVLDRASAATGLDWHLAGEPELRWHPRPWLALPDLRLNDAQGRVVLAIKRLELALPWSTLFGETLRIEGIRMDAPNLDFDAALDWWKAHPRTGETRLPIINGLIVSNARVIATGIEIDRFELALPHFAVGEAMALEVSARLRLSSGKMNDRPAEPITLRVALHATPKAEPLRLEDLQLRLFGSDAIPEVQAGGRLQFTPWQLTLDGEINAWPEIWPALPPPFSTSHSPLAFRVVQNGADALSTETIIDLRRDTAQLEARAVPSELLAWFDDSNAPALPPVRGQATLPSVEFDGIRLQGVRIEIDEVNTPPP